MESKKVLPIIEVGPHQKSLHDTAWVMKQVLFSLLPVLLASIIFFKIQAVIVLVACLLGAMLSELMVSRLRKRASTLGDYSAAVTGVLLALVLPPATPFWCAFLGSVVAITTGKLIFGGLGQNIFNPALVGRAFLMAAFPVILTTWSNPYTVDAISSATPLAMWKFSGTLTSLLDLFLGNVGGCVGETSALAILLGGAYLLIRKIGDWRAPLAMFLSTIVFAVIFYFVDKTNGSPLFHILSGGYLFGMFFMVTDTVTSPMSRLGRYVFGGVIGALVMIIRFWAGLPEGVMYSILFMNAFVPIIDKLTKPKPLGR